MNHFRNRRRAVMQTAPLGSCVIGNLKDVLVIYVTKVHLNTEEAMTDKYQ